MSSSSRWQNMKILKSIPPKDLLSLQLHTEQFPLLKNLKSGWVVTIHQENEKKSMVNQVGCTETHSYRKCHPQCYDPQPGENSKPGASSVWGVKGLNLTLGTTTFRTCTWETSPQNMELWKPMGLESPDSQDCVSLGTRSTRAQALGLTFCRAQLRGS